MLTKSRAAVLSLSAMIVLAVPLTEAKGPKPPAMHIEKGVLDRIDLKVEKIVPDVPIVVKPFGADKAELGTGAEGGKEKRVEAVKTIQREGPALLAESLVAELKKRGSFHDVRVSDGSPLQANALVVEGEFIELDPGSRAKRYWVGFGAGKSGTAVKGTVKDAAGQLVAEFEHKRVAVMGAFGGDYEAKMKDDCRSLGEDIAKFLSYWAAGKSLGD